MSDLLAIRWLRSSTWSVGAVTLIACLTIVSNSVLAAQAGQAHPGKQSRIIDHWFGPAGQDHGQRIPWAALGQARVIFLGETHDNPRHHQIEHQVLHGLPRHGFVVRALAMEQFDSDHQAAIDKAQTKREITADSIARAGHFDRDGWAWPQYRPLVREAVHDGLSLLAINLSRSHAMSVALHGLSGLPGPLQHVARAFSPELKLPEEQQTELESDLASAHCDRLPKRLLPLLARAQVARDLTMAHILFRYLQAYPRQRVVVICGREHARKDRGVPYWLKRMAPTLQQLSVGMVPVEAGAHSHVGLVQDAGVFDWRVATSYSIYDNPCSGMKNN